MTNTFKPIASDLKQLLTPDTWCQRTFAVNKNNDITNPLSSEACKFCMVGAVERICRERWPNVVPAYRTLLLTAVKMVAGSYRVSISAFNDEVKSFDEIIPVLDKYEELEKEELQLLASATDEPATDSL
jgi:hypothetical protein